MNRHPRRAQAEARREAIVRCVTHAPGCTFRALVRATRIPSGTLRHHLQILVRQKRIWYEQDGVRLRHYPGAKPAVEAECSDATPRGPHANTAPEQHLRDTPPERP